VRRLRRILKIVALVLVVLLVLGGAYVGNLLTGNAYPRPDADGWLRLKDLPRPRGESGATFALQTAGQPDICPDPKERCDPQFFIVGGIAGPLGRTVADVDILDAGNGNWRQGPALPAPRHHPGAASIDGSVYVSGGSRRSTNWKPENNLWVLRPGADEWAPLPAMPEGRMGHAMVSARGKLYVIGGRGETSKVLIYDVNTGWSEGAEMPGKRDHLAAVVVLNKIYAIGGRDDRIRRRVDVYDISTDTWSEGPPLPEATSGMAAELLGDGRIHVVGGEDPGMIGGGVIDRHFVLDIATGTWSNGPKALLAVHGAASDEIAGILLIVGGSRRQGTWSVLAWTGVTQRFNPTDAGATPGTTFPTPTPRVTTSTTPTPTGSSTTSPTPTPT
jgi:hypothetical protein